MDSAAGVIIAAPSALSQPAPDQHPFASRQAAHERRDAEQRRPGNEQAAPAEQISGAAAEQQEPTVGEQVRARDPLQVLDREVQMSPGSAVSRHSRWTHREDR